MDPPQKTTKKRHSFKEIGINNRLCSTLSNLGLQYATEVQVNCIPEILKGSSVLAVAPTGSGKTLAFALPMIQDWSADPYGIFGVILSPTRELAIQIKEQFEIVGGSNLRVSLIIGGLDFQTQALELQKKPHFVVATPGRLADLSKTEGNTTLFKNVKYLVVDEADLLCGGKFDDDLIPIIGMLRSRKQTLFFSATHAEDLHVLHSKLNTKNTFTYPPVPRDALPTQIGPSKDAMQSINTQFVMTPPDFKDGYMVELLRMIRDDEFPVKIRSTIVFTATCTSCKVISSVLTDLEFSNVALHSHLSQKERQHALLHFKSKRVPILVATDVAGRGLDIPIVDFVLNHDVPFPAVYVHRVGRTGRSGERVGTAITLVTPRQIPFLTKIEAFLGRQISEFKVDEEAVLKILTQVQAVVRTTEARIEEESGEREMKTAINAKKRKLEKDLEDSDEQDSSASSNDDDDEL